MKIKTLMYIFIAWIVLALGVRFFLSSHERAEGPSLEVSAPERTPKEPEPQRLGTRLPAPASVSGDENAPAKTGEDQDGNKERSSSFGTVSNSASVARRERSDEIESEPEVPVKPAAMTMAEEIQANIHGSAKGSSDVANDLPTDSEIEASIDAERQESMKNDKLAADHLAQAKAISSQVRSMGSDQLSPMTDPSYSPPASQTPPQELVEQTRSGQYVAH